MSKKVVSLADRRRQHMAVIALDESRANGSFYDLWVEADGSLMMRIDKDRMVFERDGLMIGEFEVRADGYDLRIAPADVERFRKDFNNCVYASRERCAHIRGDHLWRGTPRGDGTFLVAHRHQEMVFVPFRPRLRHRRHGGRAPQCVACRRVVQIGETMYRERAAPGCYRSYGNVEICATCISSATPRDGIGPIE